MSLSKYYKWYHKVDKPYNEQLLETEALKVVSGLYKSERECVDKNPFSRTVLHKKIAQIRAGTLGEPEPSTHSGRKRVFSQQDETQIAAVICGMARAGFGVRKSDYVTMPADGHCLFSAMSHAVYGEHSRATAQTLRLHMVEYVCNHWEEFSESIEAVHGILTPSHYRDEMGPTSKMGDHPELSALSDMLEINPQVLRGPMFEPESGLTLNPNPNFEKEVVLHYLPEEVHFNLLLPKTAASRKPVSKKRMKPAKASSAAASKSKGPRPPKRKKQSSTSESDDDGEPVINDTSDEDSDIAVGEGCCKCGVTDRDSLDFDTWLGCDICPRWFCEDCAPVRAVSNKDNHFVCEYCKDMIDD